MRAVAGNYRLKVKGDLHCVFGLDQKVASSRAMFLVLTTKFELQEKENHASGR